MSSGCEACLTALDTYWDTSIIAKPTMRVHTVDKTQGATPQTTIIDITNGEADLIPASLNQSARIRSFPVQIHFFALDTNSDLYIRAIEKALLTDTGAGYWWTVPNSLPNPIDKGKRNGEFTHIYDVLMLAIKKEWITSW